MHRLNYDRNDDQMERPCGVFNMIGGVGSGGFISILLAILGLTVEEALQEFTEISVDVLEKEGVDAVARTTALKERVDNLIVKHNLTQEARLLDPNDRARGCKLAVPISYRSHVGSICILRNYPIREEQALNLTIAEALMATLATPPRFTSTRVVKDSAMFEYTGADWTLGNPTQEIISEAHRAFGSERKVACLLSLGCGHSGVFSAPEGVESAEWNQFLERLMLDGERKAQSDESQMGRLGLYHRLSVSNGLEKAARSSRLEPGEIVTHTNVYLDDTSVSQRMNLCIESIKIRDGVSSLEQLRHPGGQVFLSPHLPPLTRTFVMRKEPWDFIHRVLLEPRIGEDIDGPTMLVLTGIGGCGKTQLMLKFMKSYQSEFSSQFFIDGSSKDRIRADILRNVRALGTEHSQKTFEDCIIYLSHSSPGHMRLLLYDNVDDPDLDLSSLLPQGNSCAIAITSRNSLLGDMYPEAHLRLDVMSVDEAVDLLLHSPTRSTTITESTRAEAVAIAEALSCLPVALQQARSYMQQTKCSPGAYLQRLSANRHKLLSRAVKHQLDAQAASTYAAFETSFDKLAPQSQKLLRLLSHFHWRAFPLELVTLAAKYNFYEYEEKRAEYTDDFSAGKQVLDDIFLQDGEWDILNLDDMTRDLQSYSLSAISPGIGTSLLQMHPLVHEWIRSCIPENQRSGYQSAAVVLLALGARKDHHATMQYLPSHAIHMSPLWEHLHVNEAVAFGSIMFENGLYPHALRLREMVVKNLQGLVDANDINMIKAMSDLASVYHESGRLHDAVTLQESLLKSTKETLGDRDLDTIKASSRLAWTYMGLGRINEAEVLQAAVLKLRREILGEQQPDTISSLDSLGAIYWSSGRLNEAMRLFEEALELHKKILGERHPDTVLVSCNLALVYAALGRLEEAKTLQEHLLKTMKEMFGERHPDTLTSLGNLIGTYDGLGRLKEVYVLQKELLKQRKAVLGERHPETIKSTHVFAISSLKMGKIKESEALCQYSLKQANEVLGEQHPITIAITKSLAVISHESGKLNEAKELQAKVLEQRKEIQGENHPDLISDSSVLGLIYHSLGMLHEASELLEDALKKAKETVGEGHPVHALAKGVLGPILRDLGHWNKAEILLKETLSTFREMSGDNNPDTIDGINALTCTLRLLERLGEAENLAREAQTLSIEALGNRHPLTLMTSHELAAVLHDLGRLEEALELQNGTLDVIKEVLDERHFKTTKVMLLLARIYVSLQRQHEALNILTTVEPIISEMLGLSHPQYLEYQTIKADYQKMEGQEAIMPVEEASVEPEAP